MKLIERQAALESAVDKWIAYHLKNGRRDHKYHWGLTSEETIGRLMTLKSEGVTQRALDQLFNACDWSAPTCSECYQPRDRLVHYGQEPDYEAIWQFLCEDCLKKGLSVLHP